MRRIILNENKIRNIVRETLKEIIDNNEPKITLDYIVNLFKNSNRDSIEKEVDANYHGYGDVRYFFEDVLIEINFDLKYSIWYDAGDGYLTPPTSDVDIKGIKIHYIYACTNDNEEFCFGKNEIDANTTKFFENYLLNDSDFIEEVLDKYEEYDTSDWEYDSWKDDNR